MCIRDSELCNVAQGGNCGHDVDECASSPCQNGALCHESSTNASVAADAYMCACLRGFDDPLGDCRTDIDECASSPCVNGARCSDSNSGDVSPDAFSCACTAGYTNGVCEPATVVALQSCQVAEGGACDVDVDECASTPCGHGARCIESNYTCLLYTSPSPRDATLSRMPSSA